MGIKNSYITFKELLAGIVIFMLIVLAASWLGNDFRKPGEYQYAEPGDSWESTGF